MSRVMEEARTRGVRSVYAYVRGDNKVGHSHSLTLKDLRLLRPIRYHLQTPQSHPEGI